MGKLNYLNNKGVSNRTFWTLEVVKGNIPGHSRFLKTGDSVSLGADFQAIMERGGRYPFPVSAQTLTVVSTSANDTYGGTGANIAMVAGLDEDHEDLVELITLTGTTPKISTGIFLRTNTLIIVLSGNNKGAEGTIDFKHGTDILAQVLPLDNRSNQLVFTVPANTTAFMYSFDYSSGRNDELESRVMVFAYGTNTGQTLSKPQIYQNSPSYSLIWPADLPAKSDVEIIARATGSASPARVAGLVQSVFVDEDYI